MTRPKPVTDVRTQRPYSTARDYIKAGWPVPLPLPPKEKEIKLVGWTGGINPWSEITKKRVLQLIKQSDPKGNICLRLPPGYIAIDVDDYSGKGGGKTYRELEERLGKLPPTLTVTARRDGISGIRIFKCPPGIYIPGKLGEGIELIHQGYRYVNVAPSWNPLVKTHYRWYPDDSKLDGSGTLDIPNISECADLPEAWVEYISSGKAHKVYGEKKFPGGRKESDAAIEAWLEDYGAGDPCGRMIQVLNKAISYFEAHTHNPHDEAVSTVFCLSALGREGHRGLSVALSRLGNAFVNELRSDEGKHSPRDGGEVEEWLRLRDGAIKKQMKREDDGEFDYCPDHCLCRPLDEQGRPVHEINVQSYRLHEEVAACFDEIAERGMYLTGDQIVLYREGRLHTMRLASMRTQLDKIVNCYRNMKIGEEVIPGPANPPRDLVEGILDDPLKFTKLHRLDRLIRTPFYVRDSGKIELISSSGYYPDHQLILELDDGMLEAMPYVQADLVEDAREYLLEELLGDFPFMGDADIATVVAAMLLPFVRELINGPTPLHLIEAPMAGTGKSFVVQAIATIALGPEHEGLSLMSAPTQGAEWGKKLTAALLKLPGIVSMDNVSGSLSSGVLAMVLSASTFTDRILGISEQAVIPNRALWMATGNNISASDEVSRRIVPARLDAESEKPHSGRSFKHKDFIGWTAENRYRLVWAVLTLVQNWIDEGSPDGSAKLGGYESWSAIISGILESAGIIGLLTNQEQFAERADNESVSLVGFVKSWAEKYGTGRGSARPAKDLMMLPTVEDFIDLGRSQSVRMGLFLKKSEGRVVGQYKISRRSLDGTTLWYLLETREGGVGSGG